MDNFFLMDNLGRIDNLVEINKIDRKIVDKFFKIDKMEKFREDRESSWDK